MTAVIEGTSLGFELAKPVYGTLSKICKTRRDRREFEKLIRQACAQAGIKDGQLGEISNEISDAIASELKKSEGGVSKVFWWARTDRGPGIDRLPIAQFNALLDGLYQQAVLGYPDRRALTESFSGSFWVVLGQSFEAGGKRSTVAYSRKLFNELQRNDREYKSYLATMTVLAGGVGSAGVTSALVDGVHGTAAVDLKTALASLSGIALTAVIATLVRFLEARIPQRQPLMGSLTGSAGSGVPTNTPDQLTNGASASPSKTPSASLSV